MQTGTIIKRIRGDKGLMQKEISAYLAIGTIRTKSFRTSLNPQFSDYSCLQSFSFESLRANG